MLLGALVDRCTSYPDLLFLLGVAADGAQDMKERNTVNMKTLNSRC